MGRRSEERQWQRMRGCGVVMRNHEMQEKVAPYMGGATVWVDGGDGEGATGTGMRVPVEVLDWKAAWGEISVLITPAGGPDDRVWKKLSSLTPMPEAA
jgi:hypothetical protein